MAVARQSSRAAQIPNHIPCAAIGAPYEDCMKNVSHRNAPGAIRAIALIVKPPRPNVGLVVGFSFDDMSFSLLIYGLQNRGRQCPNGRTAVSETGAKNKKALDPETESKTS